MIGLSGTVFNSFKSYHTDREFSLTMDKCSSESYKMNCGVPQGSILGNTLFNLYMLPLGNIIRRHSIRLYSYADDTQLYIAVSPDDSGPIDALLKFILYIMLWMAVKLFSTAQSEQN